MKPKYYFTIAALWGVSCFFLFALTALPRLLSSNPHSTNYIVISLMVSVITLGILLGMENNIGTNGRLKAAVKWPKFVCIFVPALVSYLYNLIPFIIGLPSFQPLPREFSMVMGVIAGYTLITMRVK